MSVESSSDLLALCFNIFNSLIFNKYSITISYNRLLDWVIKLIAKLVLAIANEYTPSSLDIKFRPFILRDMYEGFGTKHPQMIIGNILS